VIVGANGKFVAGAEIADIQESIDLLRATPDRLDGTSFISVSFLFFFFFGLPSLLIRAQYSRRAAPHGAGA
jgi:hypothetical protein